MKRLKPIIKWAGGKEKEIPYIIQNLPNNIERYIETFVGGGSVYFSMNVADSYINDKSVELINLYKCIKNQDKDFFDKLTEIYQSWKSIEIVTENNKIELFGIYNEYCSKSEKTNLKENISEFVKKHSIEFNELLSKELALDIKNFMQEIKKNLSSKMVRMNKIESEKGKLSDKDTLDNFECAFKSAFYMYLRFLYNSKDEFCIQIPFYEAIFYFLREYCYASMFRYNSNGKFNVPYGGISYNRKEFNKKIEYLKSDEIVEYMKNTNIYKEDFAVFLKKVQPEKDDFIFVDPPYDTEFSTYAKNVFDKSDQIRLADCLSQINANVMIIIKNTDFIFNLYNDRGFKIKSFDKKYLVSFKNRNDRNVKHLLITNY